MVHGMDIIFLVHHIQIGKEEQIGSGDFPSMDINETTDGSVEVEDIEWDGNPTEEELEDLNKHDLYWDSEITDSEYEFNEGSIWFMEIDVNGEKFSIEN